LSEALCDRIRHWFHQYLGLEEFEGPWQSDEEEEEAAFGAEGHRLASAIQAELGSDYEVEYLP